MAVAAVSREQETQQVRRSGFVPVPVHVACDTQLSDSAFRTFCILKRYCFGRKDHCWPSIRTLAGERGCTEETIRRHLRELVEVGLITISRRGRHNVYHFAPEQEGASEGASRVEARAHLGPASCPVEDRAGLSRLGAASLPYWKGPSPRIPAPQPQPTPHTEEVGRGSIPHINEGQRITRSKNQESTSCVGEASTASPNPETLTAFRPTACGVSPPIARRLVAQHGAPLCEQALSYLRDTVLMVHIHNPGGWLYSAITQGYLTPRDVELQGEKALPEAGTPAPQEATRAQQEEEALARAQAEEVQQRRREALARRGVSPEVDDLWQRVVGDLRAQGYWRPLLAAAYLRRVGERTYVLQCSVGGMGGQLEGLLPVVQAALQRQSEAGDCELRLLG